MNNHPLLELPLLSQLTASHYLVVENLRGISPGRPFTWDATETKGNIVGMARFYLDAQKLVPRPAWPAGDEARADIEKHFPSRSIQLSCGGMVDERQSLSFDDHPDSLFVGESESPRDQRLFDRTFTILWMAAGDEKQIAAAMANDRARLEKHTAMERERLESYSCGLSHCPDDLIRRWFNQWYTSRLCRLANEPSLDIDRIREILSSI